MQLDTATLEITDLLNKMGMAFQAVKQVHCSVASVLQCVDRRWKQFGALENKVGAER